MNYDTEGVYITIETSSGVFTVKDDNEPKMWHYSKQLEDGTWLVSVIHKDNRIANVHLTKEAYEKYGFADLKPSVENPFKLDYSDENLVEVKEFKL